MVLDHVIQNLNIFLNRIDQPKSLLSALFLTFNLLKIAQDEFLDNWFDLVNDHTDELIVDLVAFFY